MRYVIHVNRQFLAHNAKVGKPVLPAYILRDRKKPSIYAYAIKINGPSELIDPRVHGQLPCGARAWVATDGPVELVNPMSFTEAKKLKVRHGLV